MTKWINSGVMDSIGNAFYNVKQRNAAHDLHVHYHDVFMALDENVNDETFQSVHAELNKAIATEYAYQFKECKNTWFIGIVNDYFNKQGNLGLHSFALSEKQLYCFSRYCDGEDCDNWRTHETHCRIGKIFVTLNHKGRYIKLVEIFNV